MGNLVAFLGALGKPTQRLGRRKVELKVQAEHFWARNESGKTRNVLFAVVLQKRIFRA